MPQHQKLLTEIYDLAVLAREQRLRLDELSRQLTDIRTTHQQLEERIEKVKVALLGDVIERLA